MALRAGSNPYSGADISTSGRDKILVHLNEQTNTIIPPNVKPKTINETKIGHVNKMVDVLTFTSHSSLLFYHGKTSSKCSQEQPRKPRVCFICSCIPICARFVGIQRTE